MKFHSLQCLCSLLRDTKHSGWKCLWMPWLQWHMLNAFPGGHWGCSRAQAVPDPTITIHPSGSTRREQLSPSPERLLVWFCGGSFIIYSQNSVLLHVGLPWVSNLSSRKALSSERFCSHCLCSSCCNSASFPTRKICFMEEVKRFALRSSCGYCRQVNKSKELVSPGRVSDGQFLMVLRPRY